MQSFSYRVKDEIISNMKTRQKCDACILGMLLFCRTMNINEISLMTENEVVSDFFKKNVNRICKSEAVSITEYKRGISIVYGVFVKHAEDIAEIFKYFGFDFSKERQRMTEEIMPKEKYFPQVVAGGFLVCGSVNAPDKKSHLEFVIQTLDLCNDLGLALIENYEITAKHMQRKNSQIVYLKESECVEDILTLIGAPMSALEHMTTKVDKDGKNHINRTINCSTANFAKSINAASKQVKAIELIRDTMGFDNIPQELVDIAVVRLENPDMTLAELCKQLSPPLSKSGANHRLKKIEDIASKIHKK